MGILSILGGAASSAVDTLIGHASSSELQEDTQAHSAQMFEKQKEHEIDMFGRESEYATARAKEQYERQRALLEDSPGLQMRGLKSAGLNPILAATGGFKSPAGGSMPIPTARASAGAKGGGAGIASGARSNIADNIMKVAQAKLLAEQANLTSAQEAKVKEETKFVGTKTDIAEPVAMLMQAIAGLLEQSNIDRETTQRVWEWLNSEIPDVTKPITKQQQMKMLQKAKQKFPQLKGVDNAKRKIFGGQ